MLTGPVGGVWVADWPGLTLVLLAGVWLSFLFVVGEADPCALFVSAPVDDVFGVDVTDWELGVKWQAEAAAIAVVSDWVARL